MLPETSLWDANLNMSLLIAFRTKFQHTCMAEPPLTWSLPSIPDPSLVTWTPPLSIPCNPALWGFSAHKTTLLFSCLWAFACQGAVFLECLSSCCLPEKTLLMLQDVAQALKSSVKLLDQSWQHSFYVTAKLCASFSHSTRYCTMCCNILQSALNFYISSSETDIYLFFLHAQAAHSS